MKHRKKPSLGWETPDLQRLFADPPRRRDIYEAFYIAMFTGLRVHEISDLTWGQVRTEQGVDYLLIQDAKTEAGTRKVPVHSRLSWLLRKPRGDDTDPVFPTFSPEGPRSSRGGDASKLFGAWKKKLGVAPRRYVFHSARKNVTRIMEENAIPANVCRCREAPRHVREAVGRVGDSTHPRRKRRCSRDLPECIAPPRATPRHERPHSAEEVSARGQTNEPRQKTAENSQKRTFSALLWIGAIFFGHSAVRCSRTTWVAPGHQRRGGRS